MTLLPRTRRALATPLLTGVTQTTAMELDTVQHCRAEDLLRALPDASVDAVITDPPYGIGLDEWDIPIDIDVFFRECWRVLKPDSWVVFFSQMPTMVDWLVSVAGSPFVYKDHIAWVKRMHTNPTGDLTRAHESIYIYRKGGAQYYNTKGKYEDVKVPGLMYSTISIEGIQRYISDLHGKINGTTDGIIKTTNRLNSQHARGPIDGDRSPRLVNFSNVWSFLPENKVNRNKTGHLHPTVKPLALVERLVELLVPPEAIILDPFIGSGTTAVAARNLGRHYIGCDLSLEYVEMARERLAKPYTLPMVELLA